MSRRPVVLALALTLAAASVSAFQTPSVPVKSAPAIGGPTYVVTVTVPIGYRAIVRVVPDEGPEPSPAPSPGPAPGTIRVGRPFHAVMICDTAEVHKLTPGQRGLLNSRTIGPAVAAMGGQWRQLDVSDPSIATSKWGQAAVAAAPAIVILEDITGRWVTVPLPPDEAGFLARLGTMVEEMLITAQNASGEAMPAFITPDGQTRCLGATPSGLFKAAAPLYAIQNPTIPRADWSETSRPRGPVSVMNQGQFGDCVGFGSATCVMRSRHSAGQDFVLLSPTFIYAQINGGYDRGSDPADAAKILKDMGTCTMAEFDASVIQRSRIPKDAYETAKRFRTLKIYQCATFDELVSAWLLGFDIFDTIAVGGAFNVLDEEGVPSLSPGPGNHCIATADILKRDKRGRWLLEHQNSWGPEWGVGGYFFMGEEQYANQYGWQAFAVQSVMLDPTDALASLT